MSGDLNNPFFTSWVPALREASSDVMAAYSMAAARAIETIQNSGWIAGGVEQAIASTIGTGLRLALKPDFESLGWTADQSAQWSQRVEKRWQAYADRPIDCDIRGQSSIGKMTAQALRSYFAYGEVTAALPFVKRTFQGGVYGTKLQMIAPHRLVQDTNPPNLFYGIVQEPSGFPLAYRIQTPLDMSLPYEVREIPARDAFGRPQFVHVFDGAIGSPRGISPLAPALKVVRQFDQLSDATLTQALIQAIFAATVKSPDPTEVTLTAFQEYAEQQANRLGLVGDERPVAIEAFMTGHNGWYDAQKIDLTKHGKIAHLAPGDELQFHANLTPNAFYESFTRGLLREIARGLGITYEELTGDYSGATYSRVRMATSTMWGIVLYRRAHILSPFLQPIFECWLEEEIEAGGTPFNGGVEAFIRQKAAVCRISWRGPAKPQADDLKFANAMKVMRDQGIVSDEFICSELAEDYHDVYTQRAREMEERKKLGLPDLPLVNASVDAEGEPLVDPEPAAPAPTKAPAK